RQLSSSRSDPLSRISAGEGEPSPSASSSASQSSLELQRFSRPRPRPRTRPSSSESMGKSAKMRERGLSDQNEILRCVLAGFADRVVRRRAPNSPRGVMVGGSGVVLAPSSTVREAELFVAVEIESGRGGLKESLVRIASAIERDWLEDMFPAALHS